MRLLVCMVTYNRLAYSKRTLKSFLDTVTVPYMLMIVDNGSTDGTIEWLTNEVRPTDSMPGVVLNDHNEYPGKACNRGWRQGLINEKISTLGEKSITHLMRLDNDMEFNPGWCQAVQLAFAMDQKLGQVGLDYGPIRVWPLESRQPAYMNPTTSSWPGNVGGTNVIKREVYDKGARYIEDPWRSDNNNVQEDYVFSQGIRELGYNFGHLLEDYCHAIDDRSEYPEYYAETDKARGMNQ